MAASVALYGVLAGSLALFSRIPPAFAPTIMNVVSVLAFALGVFFSIWSWKDYGWVPRLGGVAVVALVLLALGIRAWAALLTGVLLWAVVAVVGLLFALAWVMPAMTISTSALLWREQNAPTTRPGRTIMKWALGIGLGGAGVFGASLGMPLVRTGQASFAYLIVAVGMSAVAIFVAQGFSHQLWPDRPWANRAEPSGQDRPA